MFMLAEGKDLITKSRVPLNLLACVGFIVWSRVILVRILEFWLFYSCRKAIIDTQKFEYGLNKQRKKPDTIKQI